MIYCPENLYKIPIGRSGENLARTVLIDVRPYLDRWPSGNVSLLLQRPGEEGIYPAQTEVQDGVLRWTITSADTAIPGTGRCEVRIMDGEVLAKSMPGTFVVGKSMSGTETEPPDPAKPWVDEVLDAADRAEESAKKAEESEASFYTPSVSQPDSTTMRVAYEPSREGMPEVEPQDIALLRGASGVHVGPDEPTDPDVDVWVNPEGEASEYASIIAYEGMLAVNTVYTAELTGDVAFALPVPTNTRVENRIQMLAHVSADTTIDFGTNVYYGAAKPFVSEGYFEILWNYNPLISAWVAGATRIGQVVTG